MNDYQRRVTIIPAKPLAVQEELKRQLKVAAYCRVSTEEEEQQSSYEAQCSYYTDKIMTNPEWTMAGIFADEGITGTSTKKREEFNRMIRKCRQKKIDLILTKSISRFARNTVDCLKYVRVLKELGIGIYFEKENLNTLDMDTELILTFMGAFAQSESESISANVRWGKRQAMKEGKVSVNFEKLYGYYVDDAGQPQIDPERGEAVRCIYDQYKRGASLRMIKQHLEEKQFPCPSKGGTWSIAHIRYILGNEKYCGDVLMQKTFVKDCLTKEWFMSGYNEMLRQIEPERIICYNTPFPEMSGNIVYVDYDRSSWRYMNYERSLPKEDLDCYKVGGAIRQEYDIMAPYRIGKRRWQCLWR